MNNIYLLLVVLYTFTSTYGMACEQQDVPFTVSRMNIESKGAVEVSLVELIANPSKFEGQKIRVTGFLNLEMEGDALYLHEEDFRHRIYRNGIFLELSELLYKRNLCKEKSYVELVGVFKAESESDNKVFSGRLTNITYCGQLD